GSGRGWTPGRSRSSWPVTVPVTPDSVTKPGTRHALHPAPAETPRRREVSANDRYRDAIPKGWADRSSPVIRPVWQCHVGLAGHASPARIARLVSCERGSFTWAAVREYLVG